MLNPQINFNIHDKKDPVRENERWYPAMKLKDGTFSDMGLRFRLNEFDARDSWVPGVPSNKIKYFDITYYSYDSYEAPKGHKTLAQIYYRIDISQ